MWWRVVVRGGVNGRGRDKIEECEGTGMGTRQKRTESGGVGFFAGLWVNKALLSIWKFPVSVVE